MILCDFVLCYSRSEKEMQTILDSLFKLLKPGGMLCGIDDSPFHSITSNLEKYGIYYPNPNPE